MGKRMKPIEQPPDQLRESDSRFHLPMRTPTQMLVGPGRLPRAWALGCNAPVLLTAYVSRICQFEL